MKFTFAAITAFAATALAQNVQIASPKAGQTVQAGQQVTVQIERPVSPAMLLFPTLNGVNCIK